MSEDNTIVQQNINTLDIDVFSNDVELYIQEWKELNNISDILTMDYKQSRFYDLCYYIQTKVFKPNPELLITKGNRVTQEYDKSKVNQVLEYYIRLCYKYGIVVNIKGFTEFTGIHRDTINAWGNDSRFSSTNSDVDKKISVEREESLVALLLSDKGIPTKYLAALNKYHGWNLPGVSKENSKHQITERQLQEIAENPAYRIEEVPTIDID